MMSKKITGLVLGLVLLGLAGLPAADAEATDATKSESSGSGLQFVTSGVLAQFTVSPTALKPLQLA